MHTRDAAVSGAGAGHGERVRGGAPAVAGRRVARRPGADPARAPYRWASSSAARRRCSRTTSTPRSTPSRRPCTPIPTRPCFVCGWRRSTCAMASSTRRASSASAWSRQSPTTWTRSRCSPGIDSALDRDDDGRSPSTSASSTHDPDVQEAYLYLGALYGKRGQVDQAIETLQRLDRAQPELAARLLLPRPRATRRRGQLDQAETILPARRSS